MSSKYINTEWYKLRLKLLGKDPEENYLHYYQDAEGEFVQLCENGGDYSAVNMRTFKDLMKRGLLKQIAHHSTIQPDTESYKYKVI